MHKNLSLFMKEIDNHRYYLVAAIGAIGILYIALILPETGILGGLFWLLLGWLFPSLINLLLTSFLVSFIRSTAWRLVLFLPVSLCLAASVEASTILEMLKNPPHIEETIVHPYSGVLPRAILVGQINVPDPITSLVNQPTFLNPFRIRLLPEGNEGCGCMYWTTSGDFDEFEDAIEHATGKSVALGTGFSQDSMHVSFAYFMHKDNLKIADILFQVFEGQNIIATFRETNVPADPELHERSGGRELENGYFFENVFHNLSHGTFWSPIFEFFAQSKLRQFFAKVF